MGIPACSRFSLLLSLTLSCVRPSLLAGVGMLCVASPWAQDRDSVTLAQPDAKGWIKLFRGANTSDFYTFYQSGARPSTARRPFPDNTFKITGDTIQVSGSPTGHLLFKQPFSYYCARVEILFPGSVGNCGLLLHVQDNDPPAGVFPRSIEAQGDPNQGMGQVWCIGDVWITVRAAGSTPKYAPTANEITYGGADWNSRLITGIDGYGKPRPSELTANPRGWVSMEVRVYGSDSVIHLVQDTVRIKYRLPKVAPPNNPGSTTKLLNRGLLSLQSEGVGVWYRNFQIKLLEKDPLYGKYYPTTTLRMEAPSASRTGPALRFRDGVPTFAPHGSGGKASDLAGRLRKLENGGE